MSAFVREALNMYRFYINPLESEGGVSLDQQLKTIESKINNITKRLKQDETFEEQQQKLQHRDQLLHTKEKALEKEISWMVF